VPSSFHYDKRAEQLGFIVLIKDSDQFSMNYAYIGRQNSQIDHAALNACDKYQCTEVSATCHKNPLTLDCRLKQVEITTTGSTKLAGSYHVVAPVAK
jgi:hypothetical protein